MGVGGVCVGLLRSSVYRRGSRRASASRIAELIAVGQESEASEEDRLNARKLAVMEVKPDAESGLRPFITAG